MKQYKDVKYETVTVRMPAELSIKLEAEAFRRKTTKAELIREAVAAYFNKDKSLTPAVRNSVSEQKG